MQQGTGWELHPLSAGQYHREQLRLLPQEAVLWPRDALLFVKGESRLYRGDLYALCKGGQQRALCNLYRYTPDEVIVKELLAEPGQPQEELVQALRGFFPRAALSVRLPAEDNFDKWGQEPGSRRDGPLVSANGQPAGKNRAGLSAVYFRLRQTTPSDQDKRS